jgi:hypothetical protein
MGIKNESNNISKDTGTKLDADNKFHIVFGWLAAMSVSIASAALAIIS